MSEAPEAVIEEEPKNNNEEVPEPVVEAKTEEAKQEPQQEPPKEEQNEAPKEDEQFKNKTDRMKNKKVKCEGCQAEMTLKTLRYSHKCNGKTEDKPVKPKPKTRAVAVKPIENQVIKTIPPTRIKEPKQENEVVQYSEPIEVKTKARPVKMEEQPRQLTARELLEASYNEIRRAKREAHIEKINSFKSKMFSLIYSIINIYY